jgi:hypothetical protein
MKRGLDLKNSIYGQTAYDGLTVRNGRLINNRPDGQTGIAQAAQIKRSAKVAEKISIVARGTAMGESMSEMGICSDCD